MKRTKNWFAVLPSLVIPVCLGLTLYLGLQVTIDRQLITDETVLRYLMGHPVSRISVVMFLIGFCSLLMIAWDVMWQFLGEHRITIGEAGEASARNAHLDSDSDSDSNNGGLSDANAEFDQVDRTAEQAEICGQQLMQLPSRFREHYLWGRLASGLQFVHRTGSVVKLEDELKYLADLDREKQAQRYGFVQILIWATPMLGFLGTVLGISQALGGIAVGPDNDFQQMMDGLKGSLYVAFDTTALALTLSMVLMFGQFLVDRFESQLLQVVDHRAHSEITQQFDLASFDDSDRHAAAAQSEHRLLAAMQMALEKQSSIWHQAVAMTGKVWTESVHGSQQHLELELTRAVDQSVSRLAQTLEEAIERADRSMAHRWEQWQVLLSDNARQIEKHQTELRLQTEAVCKLFQQRAVEQEAHSQAPLSTLPNQTTETLFSLPQSPRHEEQIAMASSDGGQVEFVADMNWIAAAPVGESNRTTERLNRKGTSIAGDLAILESSASKELSHRSLDQETDLQAEQSPTPPSEQATIPAPAQTDRPVSADPLLAARARSIAPEKLKSLRVELGTGEAVLFPFPIKSDARAKTLPINGRRDRQADNTSEENAIVVPFIRKAA